MSCGQALKGVISIAVRQVQVGFHWIILEHLNTCCICILPSSIFYQPYLSNARPFVAGLPEEITNAEAWKPILVVTQSGMSLKGASNLCMHGRHNCADMNA